MRTAESMNQFFYNMAKTYSALKQVLFVFNYKVLTIVVIVVVITVFNEGKDIDYWSPSRFHNDPPTITVIKRID